MIGKCAHRKAPVLTADGIVEADAGVARLVEAIWSIDVLVRTSCESVRSHDGKAFVGIDGAEEIQAFMAFAGDADLLHDWEMVGWVDGTNDLLVDFYIPRDQIPVITANIIKDRSDADDAVEAETEAPVTERVLTTLPREYEVSPRDPAVPEAVVVATSAHDAGVVSLTSDIAVPVVSPTRLTPDEAERIGRALLRAAQAARHLA